ncbi:MOSC domain-containing protein [Sinobacterium norvegicum]|nr:MOSC domain-containing protein [Sinobacterium norvegicum]
MSSQQRLFSRYAKDIKPGKLEWIGLRPAHYQPMQVQQQAQALQGLGLEGDHRSGKTPGSGRQITLISQEYIRQIAHFTGRQTVAPELLRRNLVISGINLTALRYQRFQIGTAVFEATALCHPCSRMDKALGQGGLVAMLGHGGLCAKIITSGTITVGDVVTVMTPQGELF